MGRPQLPLGTFGKIRLYPRAEGYRAMASYRDYDGKTRPVQANGKTKAAAERALVTALRDRGRFAGGNTITPDSRLSAIADMYFAELEASDLSPSTIVLYRGRLNNQILPALGNVRLREISVGLLARHIDLVKATNGNAVAKLTKTVLSGMCNLACRHDALLTNPCRDIGKISTKPRKEPVSLSLTEIREIRDWLANDPKANDRDLPDLVSFMMATGLRIGEACAVRWQDLDLEAGTVEVFGTVLRLKGQGLMLKPSPKSEAGKRVLELPSWAVGLLRTRHHERNHIGQMVFPAPLSGKLRDPSNTLRGMKQAFEEMGKPGLTSHVFRKSVASLMDSAGLSPRQAADQLGHSKVSTTTDNYYGRKLRATGAAAVLEALGDAS